MNPEPRPETWTSGLRRLGIAAATAASALLAAYVAVLVLGLSAIADQAVAIPDPWFTAMQVLVLIIAPTLVVMTAALHGFAASERKPFALLAVVFMASAALVTAGVHATILSLGTEAIAAHPRWLSFTWPSAVYALDILAWDRFFALAVLFGAAALPGRGAAVYAKWLLFASGLLSSFGLIGALMGEMTIRNIGIIGYCGFFPAAAVAMAFLFARSEPHGDTRG